MAIEVLCTVDGIVGDSCVLEMDGILDRQNINSSLQWISHDRNSVPKDAQKN